MRHPPCASTRSIYSCRIRKRNSTRPGRSGRGKRVLQRLRQIRSKLLQQSPQLLNELLLLAGRLQRQAQSDHEVTFLLWIVGIIHMLFEKRSTRHTLTPRIGRFHAQVSLAVPYIAPHPVLHRTSNRLSRRWLYFRNHGRYINASRTFEPD